MTMDVIDYKNLWQRNAICRNRADPQEAAIGEAGSMMYMESAMR
jgi:hypothetical protein